MENQGTIVSRSNDLWAVAELVVNITSGVTGGIEEWPSNIQDRIYTALEAHGLSRVPPMQFEIAASYCDFDMDHGWFIRVIAKARITIQ